MRNLSIVLVYLVCFTLIGCKKATPKADVRPVSREANTPKRVKPVLRRVVRRSPPKPTSLSFVIVGDIMVHGHQLKSAFDKDCKCHKWDPVFSQVTSFLSQPDVAVGNLETTFPGPKGGYSGFPNFGVPDSLGVSLKKAGFDLLTNANNHIYDKGLEGMKRTVSTLKKLKLLHAGAYRSKREATGPRYAMIEKNGIKVAFFSYTSHINHPRNAYKRLRFDNQKKYPRVLVDFDDEDAIKKDLKAAKQAGAEAIVVYHHFGPEYKRQPSARQKKVVDITIRAGADVVVGAHPHVVQPLDARVAVDQFGLKKPRLMAYSLGNFMSNMRGKHTSGGIALGFVLKKQYDAKGKAFVQVTSPKVTTLWLVRPRRKKGKIRDFYVLPVPRFLKNDQTFRLASWNHKAMRKFAKSTDTLLSSSKKKLQEVFSQSPQ